MTLCESLKILYKFEDNIETENLQVLYSIV